MSGIAGEVVEFDCEYCVLRQHKAKGCVAGCASGGDSDGPGPEYCWEVVNPHPLGLARAGSQFREGVYDRTVAAFYHSVCCCMVGYVGDLSNVVKHQEEVGPLHVLYSSIHNNALWHCVSTDNFFIEEISNFFRGSCRQGPCFYLFAEISASNDKQVVAMFCPVLT